MNFKTTLSLVALLALVVGYFWFFERDAAPPVETEETAQTDRQAGEAFWGEELKAEDVTTITVERGGAPVKIEKVDGQWRQTEPVWFPLNEYRPKQLVDAAAGLKFVEKFTPGGGDQPSLADVALDRPRAVVTVATKNGSRTIKLGKPASGSRGYAMLPDDASVYVVNDALHQAVLTGQLSDWRKRSFEAPKAEQLERVVLKRGREERTARKIDGKWFLDEAGTERLSEEKISALVSGVGGFYISEFVSDAEPEKMSIYGLTDPRVEVTLAPPESPGVAASTQAEGEEKGEEGDAKPQAAGEGESVTLRVGAPADLKEEQFYATWSETGEPSRVVFTISKSTVEGLTKPVDDLRDPRVAIFDPQRVRELRIERREGGDLVVQRVEGGYEFGEPAVDYKPDVDGVRALVQKLAGAKAASYLPSLAEGETPAATVTLYVDGQDRPERFTLYGPRTTGPAPQYVSLRDGEHVGYVVDASAIEGVFQPAVALRDKTILDVAAEDVTQVALKQVDGVELKFARENASVSGEDSAKPQAWKLEGAGGFEKEALDALLAGVAPLRVESWEAASMAFNADATLTLMLSDGAAKALAVETATRRGRLEGLEPMFVLSQAFVDRLKAEYRDRTVLPISMMDIDSVTVNRGGESVLIRKDASDAYVGADDAALDAEKAAGVFDTLAGLRVERYLAAKPAAAPADAVKLEIKLKDGGAKTLTLHKADRSATLDGSSWFTLGEEDAKKLTDGLTAAHVESETPGYALPGGVPGLDMMGK